MKNKKAIYIVILILLVLVGGFFYTKSKKTSSPGMDLNLSGDTNIFVSVKDALSKNLTFACEFKDETGVSTTSYIKNGAVRVSSINESGETSEMIFKDNKMYTWDLATKEGIVYDVSDSEDTDADSESVVSTNDKVAAYYNMIDLYKDSCKVTAVSDSYFEIPTDVKFQDMNEFLQNMMNQIPQLPQGN